jgi:ComF family protein
MKTSFWTKLFDLISPRQCVSCGQRLSAEQAVLCLSCRLHLPLTNFAAHATDNRMARMYWGQIAIERAAAYFYYEPKTVSGDIIYALKYYGRQDVAESMGRMVARDFIPSGFFDGIDVLVPVPLTRWRQWQRGYNQSLAIARGMSEVTGIPVEEKALVRTRFTDSQTHQSLEHRRDNVENAFLLRRPDAVRGLHVRLVDDVVTTGSTTVSCARELLKVEGVRISILSLGFTR